MSNDSSTTLGQFIAARLVEVGCTDYFGVPGNAPRVKLAMLLVLAVIV